MAEIIDVHAREILDSRGNPTIEVEIMLGDAGFTSVCTLAFPVAPTIKCVAGQRPIL